MGKANGKQSKRDVERATVATQPVNDGSIEITCVDCAKKFIMSKEEQDWYLVQHKDRGFILPTRCADCRKAKRKRNNDKRLAQQVK